MPLASHWMGPVIEDTTTDNGDRNTQTTGYRAKGTNTRYRGQVRS